MSNQNFNKKTEKIRQNIIKMSDDVRFSFEEVEKALEDKNPEVLGRVSDYLKDSKELNRSIEDSAVGCLALYGPEATELRRLIAFMKISSNLDKTSEMLIKFSKRILPFMDTHYFKLPMYKDLIELFKCSVLTIKLQNEACRADGDFDYLRCLNRTKSEETRSDELFSLMYKDIVISNYKEEMYIRASIEIFNAGRRVERSADLAVETIDLLRYAKSGAR